MDATKNENFQLNKSAELLSENQKPSAWYERVVDGFLESAKAGFEAPGKTAGSVGSGLALGALIQTGLNNAELAGGKVGIAADIAKAALISAPAILIGKQLLYSDDAARDVGKIGFDFGLFLGAAKLGRMADLLPGSSKLMEPRALTPVPEGLTYRLNGGKAVISGLPDSAGLQQIRLANGQGFIVPERPRSWNSDSLPVKAPLIEMPREIKGIGQLEYSANSTTLHTANGSYVRNLDSRVTSTNSGPGRLETKGQGYVDHIQNDVSRRFMQNGEQRVFSPGYEASLSPNGMVDVLIGSYHSGRLWTFHRNGAVTMKSLPYGKYRVDIGVEGTGTYTFTHGTSRGIAGGSRGMAGRTNFAPLEQNLHPARLESGQISWSGGSFKLPEKPQFVDKPDFSSLQIADRLLSSIYR